MFYLSLVALVAMMGLVAYWWLKAAYRPYFYFRSLWKFCLKGGPYFELFSFAVIKKLSVPNWPQKAWSARLIILNFEFNVEAYLDTE